MTNGDLIKILQRFPAEGPVKVRRYDAGAMASLDVDRAEMVIDSAPIQITQQNVPWADLVKERIQTVLVYGEPRVEAARKEGS